MRTGVCANQPVCGNAVAMRRLELYPGPGLFCPDCGERLVPLPPADVVPVPDADAGTKSPRPRWGRLPAFAGLAVASFAAGSAAVIVHSTAVGGAAKPIRVCRSTAAERVTADVVRGYAAKSGVPDRRFVLTGGPPCDVRFATVAGGAHPGAVAADALVAIVNPRNPVASLSADDVRRIFSGSVRNWAELGGRRAPIAPMLPAASTDVGRALGDSLLRGVAPAARVRRLSSSAAVTAAVAGGAARGAIGLVPFSAAAPAKVLTLAKSAAPNAASIADAKYPYLLAVVVEQAPHADAAAAGLVAFAQSADGQSVIGNDGLVPRRGR